MNLFLELARRDHLTDLDVSMALRTSRQRASDLLHDRIERFNSETLIDILWRFGGTIDVVVTQRRRYLAYKGKRPRPSWMSQADFDRL